MASVTVTHDIFISYSHKDRMWVSTQLLPRLEGCGFSVIVDFRDFRGGAFGVEEMERAVMATRKTIAVFTNDYLGSAWGKLENIMAQSLDPGAMERRIVPVLASSCHLPLRLSILHYRDLSSNDPVQWDLLMRDLV